MPPPPSHSVLAGALTGGLLVLAASLVKGPRPVVRPQHDRPSVVLVVMDTVRADRTSLCGYQHPTTPFLQRLADREDVWVSCQAYAPSSWTLPSHASFFTGLPVHEHGADTGASVTEGVDVFGSSGHPLGPEHPTVAEVMRTRGYQPALLSANPVLGPMSGLNRGFWLLDTASDFRTDSDVYVQASLGDLLGAVNAREPLFLVLNVADAHDPLPAVPEGHAFLPPVPEYGETEELNHPHIRARRGELSQAEEAHVRAWRSTAYDHGVERADHTVERALDRLRRAGWLPDGSRVVITSDHGEHLGEHTWGHATPWLFEPEERVPLVVWTVGEPASPAPQGPIGGARLVHDLVLHGTLTQQAVLVETREKPAFHASPERPAAACVSGTTKWLSRDGRLETYDLRLDPGERQTLQAGRQAPCAKAVLHAIEALDALGQQARPARADLAEQLKALGYTE